jgi:peptidoglycan/LPS O-acetylase OafA/YrhL
MRKIEMPSKIAHRPEIDGLRAIAVIPVILFHAGFQTFSGGFAGVDVFFVISGYLITSIIMKDIEARRFSFADFYERRARRILPALFVMLALCLPFAWAWIFPVELKGFSTSLVSVCLFSSNILFWRQADYFDVSSELKPLLHTWSLAVEEQFYVVHPIILLLLVRFARSRLRLILSASALASLFLSQYLSVAYPSLNFYLLPTRAWELLAGGLCALTLTSERRGSNALGLLGLGLLLVSIFALSDQTPMPSFYGLIPVLGTCLIILCARQGTYVARLLSIRPVVLIGLISYSAYLFHQPVLVFARIRSQGPLSTSAIFLLILLIFAAAYLSWRFVEMPWRTRKGPHAISRNVLAISAATFVIVFMTIGFGGHVTSGYPAFVFRPSIDEKLKARIALPKTDNGWCFYSVDSNAELPVGAAGVNCSLTADKAFSKHALLFGDSFAGQYEPFWRIIGDQVGINVRSVTTNWCYPALTSGFTGPASSRALRQCLYDRNYLSENMAGFDAIILGGHWGQVLSQGKFQDVLDAIRVLSERAPLILVMASPTQFDQDVGQKYLLARALNLSFSANAFTRKKDILASEANDKLKGYASNFKNVLFLDRSILFNVNGYPSDVSESGAPFSLEGVHISILGSEQAARGFTRSEIYNEMRQRLQTTRHSAQWSPHVIN